MPHGEMCERFLRDASVGNGRWKRKKRGYDVTERPIKDVIPSLFGVLISKPP
jgi:hypothetical protein